MQDVLVNVAVLGGVAIGLFFLTKAAIDHYFEKKRDLIDDLVRKQRDAQ